MPTPDVWHFNHIFTYLKLKSVFLVFEFPYFKISLEYNTTCMFDFHLKRSLAQIMDFEYFYDTT